MRRRGSRRGSAPRHQQKPRPGTRYTLPAARPEDCRAEPRVGGRRDRIPMACGFLYLVAIIDWASRAVLAWRLSNTDDASFCAAALEEALLRFGKPRIFNTDQGSTFTAEAFNSKLVTAGVEISMDGRGRFMDNISSNDCGARSSTKKCI